MARAARIEYAGGWYHVSNRGAGRQRVFRNDHHRQLFLDLLGELQTGFQVQVHGYCLMSNRYDLILHTAKANLAMAMRHVGGVYTQRYNRDTARDGPLFRGRYRAVIFDPTVALLAVSRHLHRRPLVTGTVQRLDRYRWSSYPSFVTRRRQPDWLQRNAVLQQCQNSAASYRRYVEREGESNELVRRFYRQRRPGAVLGGADFRRQLQAGLLPEAGGLDLTTAGVSAPIPPRRIIRLVADRFGVPRRSLLISARGRLNEPRLAALWLCRQYSGLTLERLAQVFGMQGFGSVSSALHRARRTMDRGFWRRVETLGQELETGL